MKEQNSRIIVTWDFTALSEYALEHAVKISKAIPHKLELLHIVNKSITKDAENKIMNKLKKVIERTEKEYAVSLEPVILRGSIYSKISEYASDMHISMVIMGTHGIKGMQKITGSSALKVLTGSKVPFIIVQDKPASKDVFKDIVLPVDFKTENKGKLQWALILGNYFNSKIHLIKISVEDKYAVRNLNVNLNSALRLLIQNNIEYEIHSVSKPKRYATEIVNQAKKIKADLILTVMSQDMGLEDYIFGAQEQYLIANRAKIPVMCVNPSADVHFNSYSHAS